MLLGHAVALAEARSYVAALSDRARTFDASMEYERVLLQLDSIHGGLIPPTTGVPTSDPTILYEVASDAIENLAKHDVDKLDLEICLAMLAAARAMDLP
jgi:hypothetical protein